VSEAQARTALAPKPLRLAFLIPEGSNRFLRMLGDLIGYSQEHWAPFNVRCQAEYIEAFNPEALAAAAAVRQEVRRHRVHGAGASAGARGGGRTGAGGRAHGHADLGPVEFGPQRLRRPGQPRRRAAPPPT
jgi:hypothetical protein